MQAQVKLASPSADPCITAPDAKYRGAENQLYRVEIHKVVAGASGTATSWSFKWSRDNGSTAAAIVKSHGPELTVYPARGFAAGHWVELTNAGQELRGEPGAFAKVVKVEGDVLTVDPPASGCTKVRRWDQGATGGVKLVDGVIEGKENQWLDLEQGIQVCFEPSSVYRSGDYWLIPARAATGQIEWPLDENDQPVQAGTEGFLVGSTLHNRGMPLIRYRTTDRSALLSHCCPCGRQSQLTQDVTTKSEDLLRLRDGRLIPPSVLTHPFKPLDAIEGSQIVQTELDRLLVRIVPGGQFGEPERNHLLRELRLRLGEDMHIDIECVDELPRTARGKFKWVISEVDSGL